MILQFGSLLTGLGTALTGTINLGGGLLGQIPQIAGQAIQEALPVLARTGANLLGRELTRDARRDAEDAQKAQLRALSNALSPTVAPGQGPVSVGGRVTGEPYSPSSILPPSIAPPARILQIDPGFSTVQPQQKVGTTSAGQIVRTGQATLRRGTGFAQPVGFMSRALERAVGPAGQVDFVPGLLDLLTTGGFTGRGGRLPVNGGQQMPVRNGMAPGAGIGTRLSAAASGIVCPTSRYAKDGCGRVIHFTIDDNMQVRLRENGEFPYWRYDLVKDRLVKVRPKRMNPANIRAFHRAGRRVDAMERICRRLYAERRSEKKAKVRRKRTTRRKKR